MNGILGLAEISREEKDINVVLQNMEMIYHSAKRLNELIVEMLDYQNRNEKEQFDQKEKTKSQVGREYEGLRGKHLLLCEDQHINAIITRKIAERVGCSIDIAENGRIGVEYFEKSPVGAYDGILMDIRMPEMDGIEATKVIRAMKRLDAKSIPIIAVTANNYEPDKEVTRLAGMNAHLSKPLEAEILYQTLLDCLNRQQ